MNDTLKRYDIATECDAYMEECDDGEYVLLEDYGNINAENGILSEQKRFYIRQQQAHVRQHKAMLATLDIFRDQMDEIACCDNMEVVMHMLRTLVENFSQWLIDRQKGKEYV